MKAVSVLLIPLAILSLPLGDEGEINVILFNNVRRIESMVTNAHCCLLSITLLFVVTLYTVRGNRWSGEMTPSKLGSAPACSASAPPDPPDQLSSCSVIGPY